MTAISPATGIFTIGHSNHSIKCFIELLALHGVDAMERLRGVLKISESGLISMPLEAVYAEQEKKIAYAGKKQQALEARETGNENTDHRIFRL